MDMVSQSDGFTEFSSNGVRLSLASHAMLSSFLNSDSLSGARVGSGVGICFKYTSPKEVDAAYQTLLDNGVVGVAPPAQQEWGEYTAFFSDPDGNVHELVADTH